MLIILAQVLDSRDPRKKGTKRIMKIITLSSSFLLGFNNVSIPFLEYLIKKLNLESCIQ